MTCVESPFTSQLKTQNAGLVGLSPSAYCLFRMHSTQMFDGIFEGAGDNWIRRTFFPLLKPIDVAHAVFHAAVHGYTTYYYPRYDRQLALTPPISPEYNARLVSTTAQSSI